MVGSVTRNAVATCSVEDAPDFRVRGVMLDVSRGKVPTADALREVREIVGGRFGRGVGEEVSWRDPEDVAQVEQVSQGDTGEQLVVAGL